MSHGRRPSVLVAARSKTQNYLQSKTLDLHALKMPDTADNYEKIVDEGSQDEKGTVEELFGDEDDEFEVEILEYVDMVDEGYYTPSNRFLGILLTLVLLVGAGVGVLVYYAIDDRLDKESKPAITPMPTMAPVVVSTETPSGGFVCNICATGNVTIPDGVLDIVGQPKCSDLQIRGESGRITEGQCGLIQAVTTEPCGCAQANTTKACTVCAQGVVQNASGIIDVSSAGFQGIDSLTCGQLGVFANAGQIPLEFCPLLQNASAQPCACGGAPSTPTAPTTPESCKICASGKVRNPDGVLNVTAAGFPGIDSVTCGALLPFEAAGSIPMEFCSALHEASLKTCDCGQDFVCSICGLNGTIGNPAGVIAFGGQNVTCATLQASATSGVIGESQCPAVQALAATPCSCGAVKSNDTILELLATVAGEAVYEPNTSEYLAARFLMEKDPRFTKPSGRRRMSPFTTFQNMPNGGSTPPSGGGTFPERPAGDGTTPNLPLDTPDPQSNATDAPFMASNPGSGEPDATPFDTSSNATDPEGMPFDTSSNTTDPEGTPFDTSTNATDPGEAMPTTMISDTISLSDLSEGQILQRYLLILLYFQTTNNRASSWTTACAAVTTAEARRELQNSTTKCTVQGNQEASRWLSEASECDWAGVKCSNATGQVQSLELTKFGLTGTLPTQILALPSLSLIDFSANNLTGSIAKSLVRSNSSSLEANSSQSYNPLKALLLGRNSLSGSISSGIGEFTNLQVLELYKNKLEGSIPSELASLVNLTVLDLSGNSLEGDIPTELGILAHIRRLLLFDNTLSGDIPSELSNLSRLQILNLAKNNFTTQVVNDLCVLKSTIIGVDCGTVNCECCSCCNDRYCEGDSVVL